MSDSHTSRLRHAQYAWPLVLCLVGVDYFSTLAYLPSIAVRAAGPFAPFAAGGVVAVTFLLALPIYWYIVGRCADGRGSAGLVERLIPGWRGKLLVLTLLGFAAVDFVMTRSLSLADAAVHLIHNPWGCQLVRQIPLQAVEDHCANWYLIPALINLVKQPQVFATLLLSLLSMLLWQLLKHGVSRAALYLAAAAVTCYLIATGIVVAAGVNCLLANPEVVTAWWASICSLREVVTASHEGDLGLLAGVTLWSIPQLALGLSGFEMVMTLAPSVRGNQFDSTATRTRKMRAMMSTAATIMAIFLISVVTVVTLVIPLEEMRPGGAAEHRALAYLAHSSPIVASFTKASAGLQLGHTFAMLFDTATVLILSLAGVSVTMSIQTLLPRYLNRLGMDVLWAGKVGGVLLTLHIVVLIVTVVFQASLDAQQWAYATSVLALLTGAAFAALADLRARKTRTARQWLVMLIAAIAGTLFAAMSVITACINHAGMAIAAAFIVAILTCSFASRWRRCTELRFHGFNFADEASRQRWAEIRQSESCILVPHRPGLLSLAEKHDSVRREFRIRAAEQLLFVEVELGDVSDFFQKPVLQFDTFETLEVVRVSQCVSVAHALAAVGLELSHRGDGQAEMIFGWSTDSATASSLNFLLFGQGNIPVITKDLCERYRKPSTNPVRIVVG